MLIEDARPHINSLLPRMNDSDAPASNRVQVVVVTHNRAESLRTSLADAIDSGMPSGFLL